MFPSAFIRFREIATHGEKEESDDEDVDVLEVSTKMVNASKNVKSSTKKKTASTATIDKANGTTLNQSTPKKVNTSEVIMSSTKKKTVPTATTKEARVATSHKTTPTKKITAVKKENTATKKYSTAKKTIAPIQETFPPSTFMGDSEDTFYC